MARPLRIICPEAWYHVTARGNERRDIFRDDKDRFHFIETLARAVERFDIRLYAYVLMDNHYHLLIETPRANISQTIQWLNVSYSVWFNRRHSRSGHLFQGRFKSVVVESQSWGFGLSAYIHLNPVRTRLLGLDKRHRQHARHAPIDRPHEPLVHERLQTLRGYRWSSYPAFVGSIKRPKWLHCDDVLTLGGANAKDRQPNYRRYVENQVRHGLPFAPWEQLTDQVLLCGGAFLRKILTNLQKQAQDQWAPRSIRRHLTFKDVIAAVEEVRRDKWEHFRDRHRDRGRDQVLYLARRATPLSLAELAAAASMNQHATVAMAIKRYARAAFGKDPKETRLLKQAAHLLQITM
jgi:REP element-mobilizing transposase RayT